MFENTYSFYTLPGPRYWFLRDEPTRPENPPRANMLFHLRHDDYFSTLATILRFYEEAIRSEDITEKMRILELSTIKNVISDLLYLDKNYTIVPKEKKSSVM